MSENVKLANPIANMENFNWKNLLYLIKHNRVIPVLGSDLYQVRDPETGTNTPLYEHMHKELCKEMDQEYQKGDFWEFMEKNKENSISDYIKVFLDENKGNIDKSPLIKLAQISEFENYICMTYDNFFQSILEGERGNADNKIQTIDFSIVKNSRQETPNTPLIFNLLGNVEAVNGFAKTEEEVLEHIYKLTEEEDSDNKLLFSLMEKKHFLFIGCNFSNWLLRFFIRIITRSRLKDADITKIIADHTTLNDPKLCLFLNNYNSKIYPVSNSTAIEFVDTLYENWEETKSKDSVGKIKYDGTVFISYCREDRENFAELLYKKLKLEGVNVFYDESKLGSGDYYEKEIASAITSCKLFVSLISKHSLIEERFVTKEIETAMLREKFFRVSGEYPSFIRPFIIDDTPPNTPRILELFEHISMQPEQDIDNIVQKIISDLKK